MKYSIVLIIVCLSSWSFAQNFQNQFSEAWKANDTTDQLKVLQNWEELDSNDPELYTSRFNYHFMRSQQEVLEMRSDQPKDEEALVIQDSLGNNAGFIGSKIIYDSKELEKSFKYIDKGIKDNPNRLDMRFGKIYVYGQLEDWNAFTKEIITTIRHASVKSSPWLWTNNEKQDGDNDFMLSAIQDYQLQLYNTQDDSLLINMREIASTILDMNPNHVESLSNLSITYTLRGEFDKAIEPLLKAESINPEDYIVIANIANTYKKMENTTKSLEYYKKLMKFKEDGVAEYAKEQIQMLEKK